MQLTRREVLAAVATAGVWVVAPATGEAAQQSPATEWPPLPLYGPAGPTRAEFESQINQIFRVRRQGQSAYGLGLAAVQDAAAASRSGRIGSQSAFTAMFVGPTTDSLAEGSYHLVSAAGAEYFLFLKRGAVVNGLQCYEVAFNNPETLDRTFG